MSNFSGDILTIKSKIAPSKQLTYEPTDLEYIFSFKPVPALDLSSLQYTQNLSITDEIKKQASKLREEEQKVIIKIENHQKHNKPDDKVVPPLVSSVIGINGVWGFARVKLGGETQAERDEAKQDLETAARDLPGNILSAFVDKNDGFKGHLRYFLPNRLLVKLKSTVKNLNQPIFPGHKSRIIGQFEGKDKEGIGVHSSDGILIEVEVPDEKGKSKQKVLMEQSEEYEKKDEVVSAVPHQVGFKSELWEPWDDKYREWLQWGFKNDGSFPTGAVSGTDLKVKRAWNSTAAGAYDSTLGRSIAEGLGNYGISKVLIAIMDYGIDSNHGSLNASFASGSSTDCTGSGTTLPPAGGTSHGTALAGICMSKKTNSSTDPARTDWPIVGIVPLCNFMTIKINTSAYSVAEIEAGINYVRNKADANNGANGKRYLLLIAHEFAYNLTLDNALEDAMNSGVLVVCAGGNTGSASLSYPASCSTASAPNRLISVGAMKADNTMLSSSSTGCNIYAPGDQIYSTLNGGVFGLSYTGTSIAAAFVAGSAAALWSRNYEIQAEINPGNLQFTRDASSIRGKVMNSSYHQTLTGGKKYLHLGDAMNSMNTSAGP